jgi:hypothetical protein
MFPIKTKNSNKYIKHNYSLSSNRVFNKVCCYPDCDVYFEGTAKSKYCEEHKKSIYRKIIDKDKIQAKKDLIISSNINKVIDHKNKDSVVADVECELCSKPFKILLISSVNVYPKFCEEHRSEHRRKMYERSLEEI